MDAEVAAAHERMVEQLMSDERLLGALPEDAAGRLLDWAMQRLTAVAETADSPAAYDALADTIRLEARQIADRVAAEGGDPETLERWLSSPAAEQAVESQAAGAGPGTEPGEAHASPPPPSPPAPISETPETYTGIPAPPPKSEPPSLQELPRRVRVGGIQATPTESRPPAGGTAAEDEGRAPDVGGELRTALNDAVERVRSLFRRRRGEE